MIFLEKLKNGAALAVMCCVAVPPGCDGNASQRALNNELNIRVGAAMSAVMARNDIPGGSIAVAHDGVLAFSSGYGKANTASGAAVTVDTTFRIGAVSSSLTGVAILKLFEAELPQALDYQVFGLSGLLPDAAYPDWLPRRDGRVLNIRLRDLLLHTAGWQVDDYDPYADLANIARIMGVSAPASARIVAAYMLQQRELGAAPGTVARASGFGYNLLGRIIERRSGRTYVQAMQELVLRPAGASDMFIAAPDAAGRAANEATYYDRVGAAPALAQDGSGRRGSAAYTGYVFASMDAQAGWAATPEDLVRFALAVGGTSDVPALLKKETLTLMSTGDKRIPGSPYAPGWDRRSESDVTILERSGALPTGSYAFLQTRDDGWTWAVTFNRMPATDDIGRVRQELEAAITGASTL
jgi:CubicO group peptidase (beta-lactamase class C family)